MMRGNGCCLTTYKPAVSLRFLQSIQSERRFHRRQALTFIDSMIVVMIIGLLAAISMPRVASVQRKNYLRNAAMTLAEHLRLGRETAIAGAIPITFSFSPSLAVYEATQLQDPEHPGETLRVDLRQRINPSITLTASFNGASSLDFGVDGLPRVAGQPVTSSTIIIADGTVSETVRLLHGWGTASLQTAAAGSPGGTP